MHWYTHIKLLAQTKGMPPSLYIVMIMIMGVIQTACSPMPLIRTGRWPLYSYWYPVKGASKEPQQLVRHPGNEQDKKCCCGYILKKYTRKSCNYTLKNDILNGCNYTQKYHIDRSSERKFEKNHKVLKLQIYKILDVREKLWSSEEYYLNHLLLLSKSWVIDFRNCEKLSSKTLLPFNHPFKTCKYKYPILIQTPINQICKYKHPITQTPIKKQIPLTYTPNLTLPTRNTLKMAQDPNEYRNPYAPPYPKIYKPQITRDGTNGSALNYDSDDNVIVGLIDPDRITPGGPLDDITPGGPLDNDLGRSNDNDRRDDDEKISEISEYKSSRTEEIVNDNDTKEWIDAHHVMALQQVELDSAISQETIELRDAVFNVVVKLQKQEEALRSGGKEARMTTATQQAVGFLLEKLLTSTNSELMTPAAMYRIQNSGAPLKSIILGNIIRKNITPKQVVPSCDSIGCEICYDTWKEIRKRMRSDKGLIFITTCNNGKCAKAMCVRCLFQVMSTFHTCPFCRSVVKLPPAIGQELINRRCYHMKDIV